VRRDPKGMGDRGTVELTEGGGGTMARRWQFGWLAWTRGRGREEGGDEVLGHTFTREDERERKEGCGDDGCTL
jgi:hypothetical protein